MPLEIHHLTRPPITEAVIEIRAPVETPWSKQSLSQWLATTFPDYPKKQERHRFSQTLHIPGNQQGQVSGPTEEIWYGFRCDHENKPLKLTITRDAIALSHLAPYSSWNDFYSEFTRIWGPFQSYGRPSEIQRIGLRFINQVELPLEGAQLATYLTGEVYAPTGLPLPAASFLHRDQYLVPGFPINLTLTRTVQPPKPAPTGGKTMPALIVDIDVFTTESSTPSSDSISRTLSQMRDLKNHVFFSNFQPAFVKDNFE